LQDDRYAGGLPVALVVPLTPARAAMRFPGTTLIQPTSENGLRRASVALGFQLRAIDRNRIEDRVGAVSAQALAEIFGELDKLTARSI
jgi:mRNA-degrading endonuclease toxin of MazEF toxin-antitoxin module